MSQAALLYPILGLISWTFVMWLWMYVTRIPAMQKAQIDVKELSRTGAPLILPPEVARVADNYNHLHEQPTIFYALVLCAAMLGAVDSIQVILAWAYVGVRVVHSLVQATGNVIIVRFGLFAVGSLVLLTLLLRTIYMAL
ncbi:MAG: MAPEG family protein [Pseudomonadaceae bacterium]|nr:MAPEG family protein [Pseudomonadaceae bacterium]